MKWRDLLYFSKGERQALTLLLSLIAAAWAAIIYTDYSRSTTSPAPPTAGIIRDTSQIIRGTARIHTDETPQNPSRKEKKSLPKETRIPSGWNPKRIRTESRPHFTSYPKVEKYPRGTIVELNSADTTILKKVPGIGSTFARRIIKYRNLLGGFYTIEQLGEVYGIDEERYNAMKSWFSVDQSAICQLSVNQLSAKKLSSHPYVSYKQAQIIERQVRKKGRLQGWTDLSLLEEFTESDRERLQHYLSFQ